jgi:hypothetical protein
MSAFRGEADLSVLDWACLQMTRSGHADHQNRTTARQESSLTPINARPPGVSYKKFIQSGALNNNSVH